MKVYSNDKLTDAMEELGAPWWMLGGVCWGEDASFRLLAYYIAAMGGDHYDLIVKMAKKLGASDEELAQAFKEVHRRGFRLAEECFEAGQLDAQIDAQMELPLSEHLWSNRGAAG
jgi:hypothetical protein